MKKIFFSLVFLLFLSTIVLADESQKEEKNPLLLIYDKLGEILNKLTELVNKDWDIIVEPNITVQPPEVNVEVTPNITLPNEECEFETFYQEVPVDLHFVGVSPGEPASQIEKKVFIEPFNIPFSELSFEDIKVILSRDASSGILRLYVNDVQCLYLSNSQPKVTEGIFDLNCENTFVEGINTIRMENTAGDSTNYILHRFIIGMQIKPANC